MRSRVRAKRSERGVTAIQLVVIMVPVLFGMIGFAVDLGMFYSAKGELKAAASSMALAAAQQLIGTEASTDAAAAEAQLTVENNSGFGNRYNFNQAPVGQTTGTLTSTVSTPSFYATAADAVASGLDPSASAVGGSLARYVRVNITGDVPVIFWSFLPIVTNRNVSILGTAVAGISAPLCEACGIEPYAIPAQDPADEVNWGFTPGLKYSFNYLCTGASPPILGGGSRQLSYLLLNRQDPNATVFTEDIAQAFRVGAGGIPANPDRALACLRVNALETIWPSAVINPCNANRVAQPVQGAMCGIATRFTQDTPPACSALPGVDTLATIYSPDSDLTDHDTYAEYTGRGRRLITVPVVNNLSDTAPMTILGFRQFLISPDLGATTFNPTDVYGRFVAMYVGSVAPVKQGSFTGCQLAAGPGKVVLHQ